jgi:nifR3 family TIM-barrel protein
MIPKFILAPMDDVTDTVFRQIVADCAPPDLFFTEFVNVDGLQSPGRERLIHRLAFSTKEKPIIAQIWGLKPENFYKTTKELIEMGFAGVDINMGCPVSAVVKNGACSGLMNNRDLAVEIIKATQKAAKGKIPVSVKTRLGFNEFDLSWHELLLNQKLDMLTIHGRTRKQMSKVPSDWGAISDIRGLRDKLSPETLIAGNGDVLSRTQGLELAKKYKLDGIMIGRGIFQDPYIFAENSPWLAQGASERVELYKKHIQLFKDTYKHNERSIRTLNKYCKIYINGFDGAKDMRDKLMHAESIDQLLELVDEIHED